MAVKFLGLLVLTTALAQGQVQFTEITLDDHYHQPFLTNPLIGKTIGIPKLFSDILTECVINFPNGIDYEAFPTNRLPPGPITFLQAVQPFTACSFGFLNAPISAGGTYELFSTVRHTADNSISRTRQRHHLTFIESEVVFPVNADDAAVNDDA